MGYEVSCVVVQSGYTLFMNCTGAMLSNLSSECYSTIYYLEINVKLLAKKIKKKRFLDTNNDAFSVKKNPEYFKKYWLRHNIDFKKNFGI